MARGLALVKELQGRYYQLFFPQDPICLLQKGCYGKFCLWKTYWTKFKEFLTNKVQFPNNFFPNRSLIARSESHTMEVDDCFYLPNIRLPSTTKYRPSHRQRTSFESLDILLRTKSLFLLPLELNSFQQKGKSGVCQSKEPTIIW